MTRKRSLPAAVLLLLCLSAVQLTAGRLGDFKDKLNNSDNSTSSSSAPAKTTDSSKSNPADSTLNEDDNIFSEIFVKLLAGVFVWNHRQSYLYFPYERSTVRFNTPGDAGPAKKRWYITAQAYYRYYDEHLSAMGFEGIATWRMFKIHLGLESYTENDFNFRDGMNIYTTMFGLDVVTMPGFMLDYRLGWLRVSEVDINKNMFAHSFNSRIYIAKPLVWDMNYLYAFNGNVDFRKAGVRLGFIIRTGMSAMDIGIGYNQIKLDSDPWERGGELSLRFWM